MGSPDDRDDAHVNASVETVDPSWLENGIALALAHVDECGPAGSGKLPAAVIFRIALRHIYGEVLAQLARRNKRIRMPVGMFAGTESAAMRAASAQRAGLHERLGMLAAAAAVALERSDGEWGAALQQLFEPVAALTPRWSGGGLVLMERSRRNRRSAGAYYTPDWIVRLVLDWSIERFGTGRRSARRLPLVYDPACGSGRFLLPAMDRLMELEQLIPEPVRHPGASQVGSAALDRVLGRDIDPMAADLCSAALALQHVSRARHLDQAPRIGVGDSLLAGGLPAGAARRSAAGPRVIIGNPPFVNAIGRRTPAAQIARYRARYRQIKGAADTAAFFLAHAAELAGPDGVVGLVLPRAILNSPSAELLRGDLPHGLRPEVIWAPDEPYAFSGAAVYFCVIVLGGGRPCRFSTHPAADSSSFRTGAVESANWWNALCRTQLGRGVGIPGPTTRLGDVYEVQAGLTAGEAYELRGHLVESRDGPGIKLLTTGLIDPGSVLWGRRTCRFLKADYRHPRVDGSAGENPRLARRLKHAARPKLIVAGLARRIECCLDLRGEFLPSVSTLVVTHPNDDTSLLGALEQELNAPRSAELVYRELGAHALGGGNITIRKSFLLGYPLSHTSAEWK